MNGNEPSKIDGTKGREREGDSEAVRKKEEPKKLQPLGDGYGEGGKVRSRGLKMESDQFRILKYP